MKLSRKARRTIISWLLLSPLIVAVLFPFAVMFITAIKPATEVLKPTWWPSAPQWQNFLTMWEATKFGTALWNSLYVAVLSTLLSLVVSIPAAYALHWLGTRQRAEIFVLALPLRDLVCLRRDAGEPFIRDVVGRCDADLLADHGAHAHIDIGLFDVLVDVVVRKARERRVVPEDFDLGLVGAAAGDHGSGDATHLLFAEHRHLPAASAGYRGTIRCMPEYGDPHTRSGCPGFSRRAPT